MSFQSVPAVVIINGAAGVGKSTFINICHQINPAIEELSTVFFVKKVARFAGWNGIKDARGRKLLSDIKDALDQYDNITIRNLSDTIDSNPDKIFFICVREPKDIQYFVKQYGALTVLITNNRIEQITSNHADANVFNCVYDVTIANNGSITDLEETAKKFLSNPEDFVSDPLNTID